MRIFVPLRHRRERKKLNLLFSLFHCAGEQESEQKYEEISRCASRVPDGETGASWIIAGDRAAIKECLPR